MTGPDETEIRSSIATVLGSKPDPQRPRTVQVLVSNAVGRPVSDQAFASALEALLAEGRIKRTRGGPGGLISLDTAEPIVPSGDAWTVTAPDSSDWSLERHLMAPVARYLSEVYVPSESGLPPSALTWVRDTSAGGPQGAGPWSRPDFTVAAIAAHRFVQPRSLELFGFEVKPEGRCDVRSVHEAFAHTRFVHYAYLVWHLPRSSNKRFSLGAIRDYCADLGVGLIVIDDPSLLDSFAVLVDPDRKSPAPEAIDAFVVNRFSLEDCTAIERGLRG